MQVVVVVCGCILVVGGVLTLPLPLYVRDNV